MATPVLPIGLSRFDAHPPNPIFDFRRDDGREHGERNRRDWDDWRFFGFPFPYYAAPVIAPSLILPNVSTVAVYTGPGTYKVTARNGLNVRRQPYISSEKIETLPFGAQVNVVRPGPNGWVEVLLPSPVPIAGITGISGYVCMNCPEVPGGPWLVRAEWNYTSGASTGDILAPVVPVGGFVSPLGFRSRRIKKHHRRTVVARPQVPYQATSLFISHHVAKHFDICKLRVGNLELLASRDPVPAEMYSDQCGGGSLLQFPPLLPGQHVFLTVKNRSGSAHHFRAGLNGVALSLV